MRVRIDSSGNDKFPGSIDGLVESTGDPLQVLSNESDGGTLHQNIRRVRIDGSHNVSIPDDGFHRGKYSRDRSGDRHRILGPGTRIRCLSPDLYRICTGSAGISALAKSLL